MHLIKSSWMLELGFRERVRVVSLFCFFLSFFLLQEIYTLAR